MELSDEQRKFLKVTAQAVARGESWTIGALQRAVPYTIWTEPLLVNERYYACRICIANYGLHGKDIPRLPTDPNVVHQHVRAMHIDGTSEDRLPAPEVSDAGKR